MRITEKQVGDVTVLSVSGRMCLSDGSAAEFEEAVKAALVRCSQIFLFNLQELVYVDSTGVGKLVNAYTLIKNHGGHLCVCGLTKKVKDLLRITKLYTIFDVRDTEEEALAKFPE